MSKKQITDIRRTLIEGRDKFKSIFDAMDDSEKDQGGNLLLADWQAFIDDEARIEKLASVEGFQSICAISHKISAKQTYPQLMDTAASNFAEIDLAVHLVREFRGLSARKLPQVPGVRQADFEVATTTPFFAESKYILLPAPRRLEQVMASAVEQLVATGRYHGHKEFNGMVWAFSYQCPERVTSWEMQALVGDIQGKLSRCIPGTLKVRLQIYDRDIYDR